MHKIRDPHYKQRVAEIFSQANFIQLLGVQVDTIEPGCVKTSLKVQDDHLQQNGIVHAGVLSTLCDHTAGAAAGTLISEDQMMLTAQLDVCLMHAVGSKSLVCEARVVKAGRSLSFVDAHLFDSKNLSKPLVKAHVTLSIVTLAI